MGNCISYLDPSNDLGDISKGRWRVMRRLLVPFLDYVNDAMREPWAEGELRNVVIRGGAMTPQGAAGEADRAPLDRPFSLDGILEDHADGMSEIIFVDAAELSRLLAWATFLEQRDGAFELFAPLVRTLREKTARIEEYVKSR